MNTATSLSLIRLTRRVGFLEDSLYAISWKLKELEVDKDAHSVRYAMLLERHEILQESLEVLQGCLTTLRKSLH
jgi:hypothetical protein